MTLNWLAWWWWSNPPRHKKISYHRYIIENSTSRESVERVEREMMESVERKGLYHLLPSPSSSTRIPESTFVLCVRFVIDGCGILWIQLTREEFLKMDCKAKITLELEKSTAPYFRMTTVRCGWTIPQYGTVYCDTHKAEAKTDVSCPRCGVGGFKAYMLPDHYLIDCG